MQLGSQIVHNINTTTPVCAPVFFTGAIDCHSLQLMALQPCCSIICLYLPLQNAAELSADAVKPHDWLVRRCLLY
jgi:hypothetical protein